jgi:hypothetical protein
MQPTYPPATLNKSAPIGLQWPVRHIRRVPIDAYIMRRGNSIFFSGTPVLAPRAVEKLPPAKEPLS